MVMHLNRQKLCNKSTEPYKYSNEEIYNLSLIKNNSKITENMCKYCNKHYSTRYTLDTHIKEYCKKKDNIDLDNIKIESSTVNIANSVDNSIDNTINIVNSVDNSIDNTINIVNSVDNSIDNSVNNIYITNNINMPITFDKDCNTEDMKIFLKQLLLLAENKTNTENEYKDIEKDNIVRIFIKKLYNQLNKIKDEVLSNENIINIKNIDQES
jgi:hypothetical protein